MRIATLTLLVLLAAAAPARGAGRLHKAFDFEERQLGNDEDVPMHWAKLDGVDLPHYVTGRLTTDRARSGRYSFRMDLDGGSCAYQYAPALLPVAVGGRYRVSGYCQAVGLHDARARLVVAAANAAGREIPGTAVASEPFAGGPADDWHELTAELTVTDPLATSLAIRMELVQPGRYGGTGPDDIRGTAWFDDLAVAQVPRASLSTGRPANVFRRGDDPAVSVLLADPSDEDVIARLAVADADGNAVFQRTGTVHLTADASDPGRYRIPLALPAVGPGWYRATLELATPEAGAASFVAVQSLAYVQLADDGAAAGPDKRFGVSIAGISPAAWPAVVDALPLLAVGQATVAVQGAGDERQVDDLIHGLIVRGIAPVGCLTAPPAATADDAAWTALASRVAHHAGHVTAWQFDPDDAALTPGLVRAYARARAIGTDLSNPFDLSLPCPIGVDPPAGSAAPSSVALSVPPSVLPNELAGYLQDRPSTPAIGSASVRPIDATPFGATARAGDLVQRVVYAIAAGVPRVDVPIPLVAAHSPAVEDSARSSVEPTDLLPVERTVLGGLSGAACYGRVPVADGVEAFLFQRPGAPDGTAVLWADPTVRDRPVAVPLGEHLTRTDLWGNAVPLPAGVGVTAGPVPVLVSGVDVPLARLRASVRVDTPTLESILLKPQARRLHLANPYAEPISGTVRVRGPVGWSISPSVLSVSLAPRRGGRPHAGHRPAGQRSRRAEHGHGRFGPANRTGSRAAVGPAGNHRRPERRRRAADGLPRRRWAGRAATHHELLGPAGRLPRLRRPTRPAPRRAAGDGPRARPVDAEAVHVRPRRRRPAHGAGRRPTDRRPAGAERADPRALTGVDTSPGDRYSPPLSFP